MENFWGESSIVLFVSICLYVKRPGKEDSAVIVTGMEAAIYVEWFLASLTIITQHSEAKSNSFLFGGLL
jgi:hypothetical protein